MATINKWMKTISVLLLSLCVIRPIALWARGGRSGAAMNKISVPPDYQELYFGFLALFANISADVNAIPNDGIARSARQGVASTFKISGKDCDLLMSAAPSLVAKMQGGHTATNADSRKRRTEAIQSAIRPLQETLSAEGWAAVRRYINEHYRASLTVTEVRNVQ
jgi:hypothetical protein